MIVLLPMLLQDRVAQTPKDEVVISIPSQASQLDPKTDEALGNLADTAQLDPAETSDENAIISQFLVQAESANKTI